MKKLLILFLVFEFLCANERFGKMDQFNNIIPDGAPIWYAVDDKVTNLMWEVKTSSNVRTIYKWENGNSHPAIEYCENLVLNGYNDWRLPNINELKSLIDYTKLPAVDAEYFKTDPLHKFYWASSAVHLLPDAAWFMNVENGFTFYSEKNFEYAVRCVRGGF